jgi:hypothetical protein
MIKTKQGVWGVLAPIQYTLNIQFNGRKFVCYLFNMNTAYWSPNRSSAGNLVLLLVSGYYSLSFLYGMGILATLLRVYPYQATVRGTKFERGVGVPSSPPPPENGKNDRFFAESDHVILEHVFSGNPHNCCCYTWNYWWPAQEPVRFP